MLPKIAVNLQQIGDVIVARASEGEHLETYEEPIKYGDDFGAAKRAASAVLSRLHARFDILCEDAVAATRAPSSKTN